MEIIEHEDSVTKGNYNIEEIEKLKDKLQKQAEWIENNKNKAKNCLTSFKLVLYVILLKKKW